jgi:alkylhydroperoxidase family enzyme
LGRPAGDAFSHHRSLVDALRAAVFEGPGVTQPAARFAAARGEAFDEPMVSYLSKVRDASYRVIDEDVAALRAAGHSEEEIFELTVAVALGEALRGLDAGLDALRGGP